MGTAQWQELSWTVLGGRASNSSARWLSPPETWVWFWDPLESTCQFHHFSLVCFSWSPKKLQEKGWKPKSLLKRLFTTLVVSTTAPLSSRLREFLPLCIDLAAPERLKVSSPLGSFLVLWGELGNVSAPKIFYSLSQKLQEGGASWDSCARSRHSCLLDRGLNNRLKLERNKLKRNTTYGSCRLTIPYYRCLQTFSA